jgi:hypothetical protein
VHDVLCWRDEDKSVSLALGLPDFVTYRNGAKRIARQLLEMKTSILWVSENEGVDVFPSFL